MHVAMVIGGGVVLLGLFLLFGRLWGVPVPAYATAAWSFIPVWLAISVANLWVGVARAGYTLREELPILVVVAGVPIALAALAAWRLAR
jgi:hypothetical protein